MGGQRNQRLDLTTSRTRSPQLLGNGSPYWRASNLKFSQKFANETPEQQRNRGLASGSRGEQYEAALTSEPGLTWAEVARRFGVSTDGRHSGASAEMINRHRVEREKALRHQAESSKLDCTVPGSALSSFPEGRERAERPR